VWTDSVNVSTRGLAADIRGRYGLVIVLIVATYVASIVASEEVHWSVVMLIQFVTVWLIFTVTGFRRMQRTMGMVLGVTAAVTILALLTSAPPSQEDSRGLHLAYFGSALLYLVAEAAILRHLLRRPAVDIETLLGVVVMYVLLGMMFAFAYRGVGSVQTEPPFFGIAGRGTMSEDLFFSFVTLTTTGYGNLVPETNPGQSMAVLEAVLGQLFLVTAVARVVAVMIAPRRQRPS
jgi:hypothetical protein